MSYRPGRSRAVFSCGRVRLDRPGCTSHEPASSSAVMVALGAGAAAGARPGVQCGGVDGLEVDHVVPLDKGGAALDLGNLQTLCRGCHIDKTDAEAGRDPERREWRRFVREG